VKAARNVRLGLKNLWLHKLRSVLTALGVMFGVGSVVAMLAVGEGASAEALDQIRKLGSTNILIDSMKPAEDEAAAQRRSFMSVYGLTYADEERIGATIPNVRRTVPVKIVPKEGRLGERALELRVVGTTPAWFDLVRRRVIAGRVLAPEDMATFSGVCVLTETGARRLLATQESLGRQVRIGGDVFEVVGIVASEAGAGGTIQTPDQEVDAYIPLPVAKERFGDTVMKRSTGSRAMENVELHKVLVEVTDQDHVEGTAAALDRMLRTFHKREDYRIHVPLALLRQAEQTKRTWNIVLGSIAGISLLVGGIGIMNIMLASVTERTREIGIRRAIGAKRKQIIAQFLVETVVLSFLGGLAGIAVGFGFPWVIERVVGMPTIVRPWTMGLAFGIAAAVGIVFGLYPAVRAAHVDPIVALRHE